MLKCSDLTTARLHSTIKALPGDVALRSSGGPNGHLLIVKELLA